MEPRHRCVIQQYKEESKNKINLNDIHTHLVNSKIFTTFMLDDIYKGKCNLFEELPSRGPEAFAKFVNVLENSNNGDVATRLKELQYGNSKNIIQCSWTNGRCIIINNVTFPENLPCRKNVEANALESTFSEIWEENTDIFNNKTCSSMLTTLEEFSRKDFSHAGVCVVIILSFGKKVDDQNVIYGTDGNYIFESQILEIFRNDSSCVSKIPKLFLMSSVHSAQQTLSKETNEYFIYWPDPIKTGGKSFGEMLANCFSKHFSSKDKMMDLESIEKEALKKCTEK